MIAACAAATSTTSTIAAAGRRATRPGFILGDDQPGTSIVASHRALGGSPMDEEATRAVYAAKGRATVAFLILDSLQWPESAEAAKARDAALDAWKAVAEFHPLVVLNGDPDGSLFGNHPPSMGFLLGAGPEGDRRRSSRSVKALQRLRPRAGCAARRPPSPPARRGSWRRRRGQS